jgi:hypothetical protein
MRSTVRVASVRVGQCVVVQVGERAVVHFELVLLGQHDHVALPEITGDLHLLICAAPKLVILVAPCRRRSNGWEQSF